MKKILLYAIGIVALLGVSAFAQADSATEAVKGFLERFGITLEMVGTGAVLVFGFTELIKAKFSIVSGWITDVISAVAAIAYAFVNIQGNFANAIVFAGALYFASWITHTGLVKFTGSGFVSKEVKPTT